MKFAQYVCTPLPVDIIGGDRDPRDEGPATALLPAAAVAKEAAMLTVGHVVVAVADPGTHRAAARPVHQAAGVAVVPVLVHEHLGGVGVGTQLHVQGVIVALLPAILLLT